MTYIPGSGSGGSSSVSASGDVALSNPSDKQALVYDGSLQKWKNAAPAGRTIYILNEEGTAYIVAPNQSLYVGEADPASIGVNSGVWMPGSKI